jgi:hypothetical protein
LKSCGYRDRRFKKRPAMAALFITSAIILIAAL